MNRTLIGIATFCTLLMLPMAIAVFVLLIYRNKQVKAMVERCSGSMKGNIVEKRDGKFLVKYQLGDIVEEKLIGGKDLEVGGNVNVYYNPEDYNEHYIEGLTGRVPGFVFAYMFGITVFALGMIWGMTLFAAF